MGRRASLDSKTVVIGVRVNKKEKSDLAKVCEESGMTISDILRVGINHASRMDFVEGRDGKEVNDDGRR